MQIFSYFTILFWFLALKLCFSDKPKHLNVFGATNVFSSSLDPFLSSRVQITTNDMKPKPSQTSGGILDPPE